MDINDMIELFRLASLGDNEAYSQAFREYRRLSKQVNQQLLRLERKGYKRFAYNKVTDFLQSFFGRNRFGTSKKKLKNVANLKRAYLQAIEFRDSETYSIKGYELKKKEIENNSSLLANLFSDEDYELEQAFYEFLNSDEGQDIMEIMGTSDWIVNLLKGKIEDGTADTDYFRKLYRIANNFLAGNMSYDELIERMGGNPDEIFNTGKQYRNSLRRRRTRRNR